MSGVVVWSLTFTKDKKHVYTSYHYFCQITVKEANLSILPRSPYQEAEEMRNKTDLLDYRLCTNTFVKRAS